MGTSNGNVPLTMFLAFYTYLPFQVLALWRYSSHYPLPTCKEIPAQPNTLPPRTNYLRWSSANPAVSDYILPALASHLTNIYLP
jgi:hypothetical protein